MIPEIQQKQVLFDPFPKQDEFLNAALSGEYTFILYGGAIRGGKTFVLLALFIFLSRVFPGSRWAIVRKNLPTIKKNLYPSWNKIRPSNFIRSHNNETHTVTFVNGSQIIFFPENYTTDKELDRWKGLEVNGFGFEEINECQRASLFKAFERAGSYIIPNIKIQPKPIVVGTCNPTQGWVKELIYEPWKSGTLRSKWLYIQSRIYDNKPLLEAQPDYLPGLKENLNRYEYEVFVEGQWDVQLKTGGEFLRGFELTKHLRQTECTPGIQYCISIDSNVYPYIAVTCWQLIRNGQGWIIRQVDELPQVDPDNIASITGKKIGLWLKSVGSDNTVQLYGDWSLKSSNNIDEKKRSFFQIVEENIKDQGFRVVDKMLPHSSVSAIGDFVNAIFNGEIKGLSIEIGEHCKKSINDYIETKTDKDGSILKTIVPKTSTMPAHQGNGHMVDTLKDFIVQAFQAEYKIYLRGSFTQQMKTGNVPASKNSY